ncbi:hypothetical protein WCD74_01595 [Actinomycetospora sp. OC33-EN08]|uniref:Uncharacterized protein n=1 Tax=Actinomycetospora aurantiaca TaxID=3129233 RepID=A0ABU8MGJ3_9PSEU
MVSPDEVRDRESFGAAIRALLDRRALAGDDLAAVTAEARQRKYVVEEHRRSTVYSWAGGTLPQKSDGPYLGFLLARRVPVDALPAWVDALDRARARPAAGGPPVVAEPSVPDHELSAGDGRPEPEPEPEPRAEVEPGRTGARSQWWLVGATAVVLVLAGALLAVWVVGEEAPGASPLPSTVAEPFLREDFDGTELATATWVPPSDPAHVFAADRRLNLVGALDGEGRVIDSDLAPRNPQDYREIDFVASVPDITVPGAGGASLVIAEQSGRTHMLVFGPSGGSPPARIAAALVCTRPSCRSYDDYEPPPPTRPFEYLTGDEVVPFRVVAIDGRLTFFMRGQMMAQTPLDGPLRSFRFNAYSGPDERWRATVDAVRVYR